MGFHQAAMNPGLVIEALREADRGEVEKIPPAHFIFGNEEQVVQGLVSGESALVREVELATDNRLKAFCLGRLIKGGYRKEIPMI
jgi:hypothetical protein